MRTSRRQFLRLAAGAAALPNASRFAWGRDYPSRPVRIIVGFPAGGTADILARLIGQRLSERLGQTFIVENRPGANTNLATEMVAKAAPDGYTLLLATTSNTYNATLYENLNFNFVRDIAPVASITRAPLALVANRSLPAKTLPEFIAYAKANPGKINMATSGIGSGGDVVGAQFEMMAGIRLLHVPYRGEPQELADLIGGQVQVMFDPIIGSIGQIKAGEIRLLGVSTATRLDSLPDVPTVGEFVPKFEASSWQGLSAPKNTPTAIIDKLNNEVNAALADPKIKARLVDLGSTGFTGSAGNFAKFIADETEKWGKVIRAANIKA